METSDRHVEHEGAKKEKPWRVWRLLLLLWHIVWYSVSRVIVLLFMLLLAVDFWLEWIGVPEAIGQRLTEKLSTAEFQVDFDMMQCGVVRGVVLHNMRCTALTPAGQVRFKAERFAVRPDFRDLVNLEVFPQDCAIVDGDLTLMNPADKNGDLTALDINMKCSLTVDERLSLTGQCSSFGLPLELSVQLSEARGLLKRLMANTEHKPVVVNEELQRKLSELTLQMRQLSLPSKDSSRLSVTVTGPMSSFGKWKYKGFLYLQGARWAGLEIPYCRTAFHGNSQSLSMDDMKLWLGRTDSISASADVFFSDKELQAKGNGHLTRSSVEYILESLTTFLKWEAKPSIDAVPWNELSFSFDFKRSALTLDSMDIQLDCDMPEADYGLAGRGEAHLAASLKDGILRLNEAKVTLSAAHDENLTLSGSWNIGTNSIVGEAKGRLNLYRRLAELGITLPEKYIRLEDIPCETTVAITYPDDAMEGLKLKGHLEQKGGSLLGVECSKVVIPFEFSKGKAFINGFNVERKDGRGTACGIDIECDVFNAMNNGVVRVDVKRLEIEGREQDDGPWEKALESKGHIQWASKGNRLSFKIAGRMYPECIYREYLRQYNIDATNMLMRIDCAKGQPADFSLELPEKSLEDKTAWSVDGSLSFHKVSFNGLEIESVQCSDFSISAKNCIFKGIHCVTAAGDDATFDLHVVYSPLTLTFSNALLDGRPEIIGYFIPSTTVSDFYATIFKDITWNMSPRPHLQMPKLVYSYGDQQWRVVCNGIYAYVRDIKYRELKLDEATMVITLQLPSNVTIEPLNIRIDDRSIRGKVDLQLVGAKQCSFQVYETLMGADLRMIMEGLFPDMVKSVSDISISQDCVLACRGSMFLDGEPRIHLEGTMEANEVIYREQSFQQVALGWRYADGDIWWDVRDATLFSGHAKTSGHYDMERGQGQSLFLFKDISLNEMVSKLSKDEGAAAAYHGKVSGELQLDILHGWAGRKLHLNGMGHVNIREGELWSIPILSKLGQIIKSASFGSVSAGLGQISELDADIELNGVSISVPHIRTNGTILSLNGNGDYHWEDDWHKGNLHLLINVIPVKDVKLLSLLLSPLTGMFQAELTGTLQENSWKIRTFIDKLF